ncbi:MAG TPA: hypothetical protein VFZ25_20880 [Chloroflexota bacterium]|nr:hypothetical protein [Chloroflexota bacterium]
MQGLRYIAIGAMLAVIVALVAGCGSSDSGSAASTSGSASDVSSQASSRAVFVKEANAICAKEVEKIQRAGYKAFREHGNTGEGDEFRSALVAIIAPSMKGEAEGIEDLSPPAGDKAQIDAIVAELRHIAHEIKKDPSAHEYYPYAKAERLADAYGLKDCGRPAPQQ